ncbi:hypothetical protein AB0I51_47490 [Streptomyces sp. NPDC050549]|uniref:hypothetical protein n=1 Tax=Streptomyces sp. NPDC050549 TaxID=3155406 RepID=UPI00344229CE
MRRGRVGEDVTMSRGLARRRGDGQGGESDRDDGRPGAEYRSLGVRTMRRR